MSTTEQQPVIDATVQDLTNGDLNPLWVAANRIKQTRKSATGEDVTISFEWSYMRAEGKDADPVMVRVPSSDPEVNSIDNLIAYFGSDIVEQILRSRFRQIGISWSKAAMDNSAKAFDEQKFLSLAFSLKSIPVNTDELKMKQERILTDISALCKTIDMSDPNNPKFDKPDDLSKLTQLNQELGNVNELLNSRKRKRTTESEA